MICEVRQMLCDRFEQNTWNLRNTRKINEVAYILERAVIHFNHFMFPRQSTHGLCFFPVRFKHRREECQRDAATVTEVM